MAITGSLPGPAVSGPNIAKVYSTVRPTEDDTGYVVPTLWLDTAGNKAYLLVDVTGSVATWSVCTGTSVSLDAQASVLSIATATAAPPTETTGARYIIGATGSPHANWDGALNNDIVEFDGARWVATTPTEGTLCEVEDANALYLFITSWNAWQNQALTTTSSPTFANITDSGLTATRIPVAGTAGLLGDDSALAWDASDNLLLDGVAAGTSGAKVITRGVGTAPTTSPASAAQLWVADRQGVADKATLYMRNEEGHSSPVAFANLTYRTTAIDTTVELNEFGNFYLEVTATATVTVSAIPNIAQGTNGSLIGALLTIYSTTAAIVHVDPNAVDRLVLNGIAQADGEKISCDAVAGNSVTLIVDSTAGLRVLGVVGVWVNGG